MFDEITGNQRAKQYLRRTAEKGTVGNSLLFAGPDGIGKRLFAEAFAKLLLCQNDSQGLHRRKIEAGNHPDIHIYRPEGKIGMHSIAAMRQFSEEVYLAPFESKWKIFIIHEADRMLSYSANALLKTFEEPAKDAIIILLSHTPSALLPTILSRSRTIHFHPLTEEEVATYIVNKGQTLEEAKRIAGMAQGSIGQALRLLREGENPLRSLILDMLCNGGMMHYKQLSEITTCIAEHIEKAKKEIEADVRSMLLHGSGEDFSAAQKQSLEKEVEGALAMHTSQEVSALFEVILSWYRDLHLLQVNGKAELLIHKDYASGCAQALERGEMMPIEAVHKAILEVRLALERSTSVQICFENLFLKLNLLKTQLAPINHA